MAWIAWLVNRPIPGSGGQATVFARARATARAGHRCTFHLPGWLAEHAEAMRGAVVEWHGIAAGDVFVGYEGAAGADLVMATDWGGLPAAGALRAARLAQFVQDHEASFRAVGDDTLRLEASPIVGATAICLGNWLRGTFAERYGRAAFGIAFGADAAIYHPDDTVAREDRVACIVQPEKARRCPGTAVAALEIVRERRPQTAISIYGNETPVTGPLADYALGRLAPTELARLYRRARVGLCLSATNPSRIPFEMMACGLPVVELYRANTLLDLPEAGAVLALQTPHSLAEALIWLLDRPDAAARLGAAAARYMEDRTAEREDREFVAAIAAILAGEQPAPSAASVPLFGRAPVVLDAQRGPVTAAFLASQRREARRIAAAAAGRLS
ncbi:glycosyltransferase [Stella sp.]|uniref:rhamnosyltransferase WsaF family glycosyltransferase n=1 Tax=Stella sp. TaxID=2912054 RepID=UPI0035B2544A